MRLARRARVIFTLVSAWVELHTSFKVNVKQKLGRPLKKKEYFYGLKNLVIVSFFLSSRLLFPCLYNRVSGGKVTEKQAD